MFVAATMAHVLADDNDASLICRPTAVYETPPTWTRRRRKKKRQNSEFVCTRQRLSAPNETRSARFLRRSGLVSLVVPPTTAESRDRRYNAALDYAIEDRRPPMEEGIFGASLAFYFKRVYAPSFPRDAMLRRLRAMAGELLSRVKAAIEVERTQSRRFLSTVGDDITMETRLQLSVDMGMLSISFHTA